MTAASPAEIITARSEAFMRGDFAYIYDSSHSGSNFRRQFDDREAYVRFGQATLARDYRINKCLILAEKIAQPEAQVIFSMEMTVHGDVQRYVELAWLRQEGGGWRYHRGQKMAGEDLPDDPETITFADFDKLDPGTIF